MGVYLVTVLLLLCSSSPIYGWTNLARCIAGGRRRLPSTAQLQMSASSTSPTGNTENPTTGTTTVATADDGFHDDLMAQGLGLCHGILHASGVRRMSDLQHITKQQLDDMGMDSFDRQSLIRIQTEQTRNHPIPAQPGSILSTSVHGAFDQRLDFDPTHDFGLELIAPGIFKGRLFSVDECQELNRRAEYHCYRGIGTIGAGWSDQLYTLTAQHIQCKDIPGMNAVTNHRFQGLFQELYGLFPGRLCPNSICFESDGEPHLVKYHGKSKGTALHTDNSQFLCITVNAVLSAESDYTGGGTYFVDRNETIRVQQGEMLVHLGDVMHAGAEITAGVRRLMIAFLACEWQDGT